MHRSFRFVLILFAWTLAATSAHAGDHSDWKGWDALLGSWTTVEAGGAPGRATVGTFEFRYELDHRVIVRRDHSEYAAQGDRPATHHDGLMVITPNPDHATFHADSYDSEGHVIAYEVTASDSAVTFVSAASEHAPRFRLSYRLAHPDMIVSFEIAPPGKPEAFKTYVAGTCRRVGDRPANDR